MGLFDFFKKEKYSNKNITLNDMSKGDIVDYFMKSWEVQQIFEYDWGNNIFSKEYTLNSGDEIIFLEIDGKEISISKDIKISEIGNNLRKYIIENDAPQEKITYMGKDYFLQEENIGECYEPGSEDVSNLINWIFVADDDKKFISIDRWGETDIEVSVGEYVEDIEFSNIIKV